MEIKDFIKKPIVIANGIILICFIIFPYFSLSLGPWGGVSKTGLGLLWSIFDQFRFLNLLLLLIPLSNAYVLYCVWTKKTGNFFIFKLVVLLVLGYLFLNIAFFAEKSSIKFVGFGLWLSLIIAIAQMFEKQLLSLINKQLPEDKKLEE